jgi:hypothetical protein
MIYELLVNALVADTLREIDKAPSKVIAKNPPKDASLKFLNTFMCRVGLISTC